MAKTASKSLPLSSFSQKSPFFAILMYSLHDHSDISSSSENFNNTAGVSRLSFRFLWLWLLYKWSYYIYACTSVQIHIHDEEILFKLFLKTWHILWLNPASFQRLLVTRVCHVYLVDESPCLSTCLPAIQEQRRKGHPE